MPILNEDVQRFIVESLACYDSPSCVAEAVQQEFGLTVPRTQVEKYDPTKISGKKLSKRWRAVFEASRKNFRDGVAEVPIANRIYRLRVLNRLADKAQASRNHGLALQVLEQAAKETGDAYVNRRLDAMKPLGADVPTLPPEDYRILRPDEDAPATPIL